MSQTDPNRDLQILTSPGACALLTTCAVVMIIPYFVLLLVDTETRHWLAREDGPIEWASAAGFFFAFAVTLYAGLTQQGRFFGRTTHWNVWLILLAAFFLVCSGEEISWGQRMFGWDTPEWLEAINAQGETNLHNIWLFQGRRLDGSDMSFLELMLNANRLLQAFSMLYCVIVPLAHHLSPRLARTIAWFGVPVPPLALGAMFVVSYAAFRIAVAFAGSWSVIRALNELKETNAAILFLLIAFYFALKRRSESPAAP